MTGISGGGLTSTSYAYDGNGNATMDGRLGTTFTYNELNLPETATKTGLNLLYTYDASGKKIRKNNMGTSTVTDYVDGIQYTNGTIDFIQTEEGRALNNGGAYSYEYNLNDHLGNVRYSFHQDPTTNLLVGLQQDDYYPFGKRLAVNGTNNYLYNGKELQPELSLSTDDGQYDYGARLYDPVVGRWNVVDPLAEGTENVSAFNYAMNNPILMLDQYGLAADSSIVDRVIQLFTVTIKPTPSVKVLNSVDGFWTRLWYNLTGGREAKVGIMTVSVDNDGYAFLIPKPIALTAPDIGIKGGFNTVYKGVRSGLPYIGKAFNIFKRYSKAERALMRIEPVLNGIDDPKLLRAVEQKVIEYSKSKGGVANLRNAFDPKRPDYIEYGAKATDWLEKNVPHWKELF